MLRTPLLRFAILFSDLARTVQFNSVTQLCPTLCDPMDYSMPGLPVHHQLPEFTQTHVHLMVMPSNHLVLCCPLLLLPSTFPSIRVFSNVVYSHFYKWLHNCQHSCYRNDFQRYFYHTLCWLTQHNSKKPERYKCVTVWRYPPTSGTETMRI